MEFELNGKYGELPSRGRPHVTTYNRLVRDRIPDIIESMGNIPVWQELDGDAFASALLETLVRSSQQFAETESLESLADLMESVDAWLDLRGLSMEEVSRARAERRKRCGSFERRRFLEMVADGDTGDVHFIRDRGC